MDTQTNSPNDAVEVLKNLKSLIQTSISDIERKKDDLKKLQEMTTSFLAQNGVYQEHEKAAKEAARIKNATKLQLLKEPSVAEANLKAKELKSEIKEAQDGMSEYLREYERMSGSNEIEDNHGEVLEIVYVAKLIRRPSKFK